jgi:hypothetical protein
MTLIYPPLILVTGPSDEIRQDMCERIARIWDLPNVVTFDETSPTRNEIFKNNTRENPVTIMMKSTSVTSKNKKLIEANSLGKLGASIVMNQSTELPIEVQFSTSHGFGAFKNAAGNLEINGVECVDDEAIDALIKRCDFRDHPWNMDDPDYVEPTLPTQPL